MKITDLKDYHVLATGAPQSKTPEQPGYLSRVIDTVGADISSRVDRYGEIDKRPDTNPLEKTVQKFGQGAGLAANTLETIVGETPGVKQALGAVGTGINWLATSDFSPIKHLGDVVGQSETLQEVVHLYDTDKNFRDTVDGVANIARLGGDVSTAVESANYVANVTDKLVNNIKARPNGNVSPEIKSINGHITSSEQILQNIDQNKLATMGGEKAVIQRTSTNIIEGLKAQGQTDIANKVAQINPSDFSTLADYSSAVRGAVGQSGTPIAGVIPKEVTSVAKNISDDVLPTKNRFMNTEITKALDLTQGDVKNISLSTGNDVGEFIAKNKLIGQNVDETTKLLDSFYEKNYTQVRDEIAKVKTQYSQDTVPRYKEALAEIKTQINDVAGLQAANAEVDALLKKGILTLDDVQRAKELMDEHFSLYKATGDVKEGVAKSGLTNIRADLRSFIEQEVKKNTGADIQQLNNNVSTARSISDAIATRSTRGLTRATISAADFLTFLTGSTVASPIGGVLAVIAKKIYQSPSFKLKVVKFLDSLSNAKKEQLMNKIKNGEVPKELESL